ncbi:MAG: DNA (cytosine-5-)-methyltransferase [Clostridiales bacterium]|jgi:DNA (cytosine-5)-methyltransferase 1|nr:DNA (cytosine-5-)-methyltransferase [Clostridiales bacterium]
MKAVSLFCGAGGMDIGFVKAGVHVIWANEIDSDAAKTYQKNNPDTTLRHDDIKTAKDELSRFNQDDIDLVFGGPPCQGFSVAGKMNPDDERSQLIWEFLDVVRITKPAVFVMENVKALGELKRWRPVREKIVESASALGYSCFCRVLNSADFGVPQKRERAFFIGFHNTSPNAAALFGNEIEKYVSRRMSLRDCLLGLPPAGSDGNPITCTAKISIAISPVIRKSPYAGMIFNGLGRPLDLDNQANTLPASMGGNKTPILDELLLSNPNAENWISNYHKKLINGEPLPIQASVPPHIRRITTVEAAAIQTFPYGYEFVGEKSSIYRQIGNAVPCNLAESVAKAVIGVCQQISRIGISA